MVDIRTFFSGMLSDLKREGKLFQQPTDSISRPRGLIQRRHRSVGEHISSSFQTKRTNGRQLWRRSADVPDSESDDEHSAAVSAHVTLHRQPIPPLVSELTGSWRRDGSGVKSESSEDDRLSAAEVIVLLLTIVKHIVYEDIKSAKEISTSTHLVPNIANILRDIISQLRLSADCESVKACSDRDLIVVGRCLVRVFFLMLLQIGEQNNGLTWLRYCKNIEESMDWVSESVAVLSCDVKRRLLLTDYVQCCWLYVEGLLLRHNANTVVIGTVCRTTELITRHRGLQLTRCVLLRMSENDVRRDSVDSLGLVILIKLVVAVCRLLKVTRSRYVHCCTCSRASHRHCNVTSQRSVYRHHHDALGTAVQPVDSEKLHAFVPSTSHSWLSSYCTSTDSCIVSCLAIFLLGLYHHLADVHVRRYLLDTFEKGTVTCCCLPVDLLVTTLVGDEAYPSCHLRRKSMSVLVNILLNDCGGSAAVDHCSVCVLRQLTAVRNAAVSSDSALSGCETSESCRWKSVSRLSQLLHTDDSTYTIHVISQATRLASSGNEYLKQQLYCGFFMPLLVTIVHQLTTHRYKDSSILTAVLSADIVPLAVKLCSSALSTILASTAVLHQFISAHGIDMICKLADMNTTRHSALSLLEVLVNVENSDTEHVLTVPGLKTVVERSDQSDNEDDVTSIGRPLDAFVHLLFSDQNDRPSSENLCEQLQSSDYLVVRMLDLWHVAFRLFRRNGPFRQRFVTLNGPQLAYVVLVAASEAFLALECGAPATDIRMAMFYRQDEQSYVQERSLLLLVRCALSVCLRCSNLDVGIPQQVTHSMLLIFSLHI